MPAEGLDDPRVLQIVIAEHASLTATRSMGQAEMASRASMFVAALSGALVAIAFIAQATGFRQESLLFAATLNPAGHTSRSSPLYGLVVTPGVVAVIDAVLAGATAGVLATFSGLGVAAILIVATVAFIVVLGLQAIYGERVYGRSIRGGARVGRTSDQDPPSL